MNGGKMDVCLHGWVDRYMDGKQEGRKGGRQVEKQSRT